ncbi:MAG TPA: apolipoprotein N-acyltransferase, partial [Pyrinomonadaceae bacterium]|nr:apolipoprotein N-acyltransferase [Pyrinomonadaceae bacterium]
FLIWNSAISYILGFFQKGSKKKFLYFGLIYIVIFQNLFYILSEITTPNISNQNQTFVVAIQPNIPMSGLDDKKWLYLRQRHIELAENALRQINEQRTTNNEQSTIVIFPESPMNFMYARDEEFREFLRGFASRNNVHVLFNSAEPSAKGDRFHNSAVMVNERGEKIVQYDKIHLMPFGEYMPLSELVGQILPPMVGNFAFGEEYDLVPLGEARAGVMICFESHFPGLSNEFVRNGADALIEITNDGYLGNTPVLRQHLANAVFRAVETNRPVLRVTNVGITAFINERGEVLDAADVYTEATRIWTVGKSDGGQTVYVKYGDWFAVLCLIISLGLLFLTFLKNSRNNAQNTQR